MPHFEPAYEPTDDWRAADSIPTGVVLRFNKHEHDELVRFLQSLAGTLPRNSQNEFKLQPTHIFTLSGKELKLSLVFLAVQRGFKIDLSFVLFEPWYRDVLNDYITRALRAYNNHDLLMAFKEVRNLFHLEEMVFH